jgi:mRNA (guanine-N7-)-methyltransferase
MKYSTPKQKLYKNKIIKAGIDLCSGIGGDLLKWNYIDIDYVLFIDISDKSLDQLEDRIRHIEQQSGLNFGYDLIEHDCFDKNLANFIQKTTKYHKYNIINCQFSLHYSFQSTHTLSNVLSNISKLLNIGGYFISIIPNSSKIKALFKHNKSNIFSNDICTIKYIDDEKYQFTLKGCIKNSLEYFMDVNTIKTLAIQHKLESVEEEQSLINFYKFHINQYQSLSKFEFIKLTPSELKIISLYQIIVFKKKSFDG